MYSRSGWHLLPIMALGVVKLEGEEIVQNETSKEKYFSPADTSKFIRMPPTRTGGVWK